MRSLWFATPLLIWFIAIAYQYIEFEYKQNKRRKKIENAYQYIEFEYEQYKERRNRK